MDITAAYSRFGEPLYRFIVRFTGNREMAEEILQDTFIQLVAGKFTGDEAEVKNWLYAVARNKCLNHVKKVPSSFFATQEVAKKEDGTFSDERLLRLQTAEAGLPEDLKQTWDLRKAGLDYREIANILSIPLGTVKSRFSRLVRFMKKEFADD